MPLQSIRAWLGLETAEPQELAPLGEMLDALDHLEPDRARYLSAFAYLLGRVAHADRHVFGGTGDFLVAREFSALATYDRKLALMRCLFALSATDQAISTAEEGELHRIANELKIDRADLVALRVAHQRHLPGLSGS
jgi:hypothetical protein